MADTPTSHAFDGCAVCRYERNLGVPHAEALAMAEAEAQVLLEKYGWIVHITTQTPYAHTRGVFQQWGHCEFELRLAVADEHRVRFLNTLVFAVRDGRTFRADTTVTDLFTVPVRLVGRMAGGQPFLRLVFPDPAGRFPDDPACAPGYADQLLEDEPF